MNVWIKRILYTAGLGLAFCIGFAYEWYISPLNSHLCFDNGKQLTMALVHEMGYYFSWSIIFGIPSIIFATILIFLVVYVRRISNK